MPHVMIDLETFGAGPTAAIVQVGAARFELEGTEPWYPTEEDYFERTINLQSSVLAGGTIDPSTVEWWKWQKSKAINAIQSKAVPLHEVLKELTEWLGTVTPSEGRETFVWSHGAAFDIPILEHAYLSLAMKVPWDYRHVRDTRTLFHLASSLVKWEKPKREVAHTALADALVQAEDVRSAWNALRRMAESRETRPFPYS